MIEEKVFLYDNFLAVSKAPSTRAQFFEEVVNFAMVRMGLELMGDAMTSRRVRSTIVESFARKHVTGKSAALTWAMVCKLEEVVGRQGVPVQGRLAAGFACFAFHCRFRVDNASRISSDPTLDLASASLKIPSGVMQKSMRPKLHRRQSGTLALARYRHYF